MNKWAIFRVVSVIAFGGFCAGLGMRLRGAPPADAWPSGALIVATAGAILVLVPTLRWALRVNRPSAF